MLASWSWVTPKGHEFMVFETNWRDIDVNSSKSISNSHEKRLPNFRIVKNLSSDIGRIVKICKPRYLHDMNGPMFSSFLSADCLILNIDSLIDQLVLAESTLLVVHVHKVWQRTTNDAVTLDVKVILHWRVHHSPGRDGNICL